MKKDIVTSVEVCPNAWCKQLRGFQFSMSNIEQPACQLSSFTTFGETRRCTPKTAGLERSLDRSRIRKVSS